MTVIQVAAIRMLTGASHKKVNNFKLPSHPISISTSNHIAYGLPLLQIIQTKQEGKEKIFFQAAAFMAKVVRLILLNL